MFKLVTLLATLMTAAAAFADGLNYAPNGPSLDLVKAANNKISGFLLSMKGVNGSGVTACEVGSGTPFYKMDPSQVASSLFVNCIDISTSTQEAATALSTLLPKGSKWDEQIYINVECVGVISTF